MNSVKNQPATPLPFLFVHNQPYIGAPQGEAWPYCRIVGGEGCYEGDDQQGTGFGIDSIMREEDARYLIHAANAYPRLVEALRACFGGSLDASVKAELLLRDLGEAEVSEQANLASTLRPAAVATAPAKPHPGPPNKPMDFRSYEKAAEEADMLKDHPTRRTP